MKTLPLIALLVIMSPVHAIWLDVNTDGSYSVTVHQNTTVWKSGTPVALFSDGKWASFVLDDKYDFESKDNIGQYFAVVLTWKAEDIVLVNTFKVYSASNAVVFEQHFVSGVPSFALPDFNAGVKTVGSVFPSFERSAFNNLGFIQWSGDSWFDQGVLSRNLSGYHPSIDSGSNVMVFYDTDLNTCVLSSLSNFKESICAAIQSTHSSGVEEVVCGLAGSYDRIDKDLKHHTILFCPEVRGINNALREWGKILLRNYEKTPVYEKDFNVNHLAYYTDNGAFYYYWQGLHLDYENAMVDANTVIEAMEIPVRTFQFDSWWYHKDMENHGLTLWEPRFDIFPGGMKKVHDKIGGKPLTLHNRWLSCRNDYRDKYDFIDEHEDCRSLAIDPMFWQHLMEWASESGVSVYEQDWLVDTFYRMNATRKQIGVYQKFLTLMNEAAEKHGLFIQYCMPTSSDLLSSVLHSTVSHARVSNDYNPTRQQWNIGMNSILVWSLGLAPFKDCYWSSSDNPGSYNRFLFDILSGNPRYAGDSEPNPALHTLSSVLSRGPVAPAGRFILILNNYIADDPKNLNRELLMMTCNSVGALLHPDEPATPIDLQFKTVFDNPFLIGQEQIWSTHSMHNGVKWHSILSILLNGEKTITIGDVRGYGNTVHWIHTGQPPNNVTSCDKGITLPATPSLKPIGYTYILTAPILDNGWIVLGETNKFVPMSNRRVTSVNVASDMLSVAFVGGQGEVVSMTFVTPNGGIVTVECAVNSCSTIRCTGDECACQK